MKGVRCSWVDAKRRAAELDKAQRGDQERLKQMVCVSKACVGNWAAARDFLLATNGKVQISALSTFQPSHAELVVRHFRKEHGKDWRKWDADAVESLVGWVQVVEEEGLTVPSLRERLRGPAEFNDIEASSEFLAVMNKWAERCPPDRRPALFGQFRKLVEAAERQFDGG